MIQQNETFRRVRIGLTGLAATLLLLSIGGAIQSHLIADAHKSVDTKQSEKSPEPLAKLGVAPAEIPAAIPNATTQTISNSAK